MQGVKLSILICTIPERQPMFNELLKELGEQSKRANSMIQILWDDSPKGTITIGQKRNNLLTKSLGDYIVFHDDDDKPSATYIEDILNAIKHEPDCVGFKIRMTTNGEREQMCCHSLKYPEWKNNVDGFDYVRNVTHFNPVKRSLALQVMFPDKSFGEDKEYSDKVTKLCTKEIFIDKVMFHYRYSDKIPHKEKYGI